MKKILVGLSLALLAGSSFGAILATDDFSYTGALTANGWTAYSGADASITSDGTSATVGTGAEDIRLSTAFADQGTGSVFASFNLTVASLSSGGAYVFGFLDGTAMESRFGLSASGSGFAISVFGTGSTSLGNSSELAFSTSYFVTLGYNASTYTHSVWINSDGTDESTPDLSFVAGSNTGIDNFFFRQVTPFQNNANTFDVEDLVVASTFGEAAPAIPEPATMSLLGLGALAMVLRRRIQK